jgi:hypothetical protein
LKAGALTYGTQYAFTVVAINDRGASSVASPPSNSVTPFTVPSAPKEVSARPGSTVGVVAVSWGSADDNGRAISRYVIDATAKSPGVVTKQVRVDGGATSATVTGFGNGVSVTVSVHAVNEAGNGSTVTVKTRTFDKPAITAGTPPRASYNSISVPFTVNDNGNAVRCSISINRAAARAIPCAGGNVGGLWPATAYAYVVTATNAAGSASFTGRQTTPTMYATVICDDPSYCGHGAPNDGIWVYTRPSQQSTAVMSLYNGDRRQAMCAIQGDATINAKPWGGKQDSRWIRIPAPGKPNAYIPFAWVTLDGGDKPTSLPKC